LLIAMSKNKKGLLSLTNLARRLRNDVAVKGL